MSNTNLVFTAATPQQCRQGDVLVTPTLKPINPADIGALIREGDGSAHAAVASTFGMTAKQYQPAIQT